MLCKAEAVHRDWDAPAPTFDLTPTFYVTSTSDSTPAPYSTNAHITAYILF